MSVFIACKTQQSIYRDLNCTKKEKYADFNTDIFSIWENPPEFGNQCLDFRCIINVASRGVLYL